MSLRPLSLCVFAFCGGYFFALVHIGYGRNGREANEMKQRRRRWTTYSGRGKRVAARTHTARDKAAAAPRMLLQLIVCGVLFVGPPPTTATSHCSVFMLFSMLKGHTIPRTYVHGASLLLWIANVPGIFNIIFFFLFAEISL